MGLMKPRVTCAILFPILFFLGCHSAYYSAWEKFGGYKRDLLKKRVVAARAEQKAAGEEFKDALTKLKEAYGFEGGKLEKIYNTISHHYDRSISHSEALHKRI